MMGLNQCFSYVLRTSEGPPRANALHRLLSTWLRGQTTFMAVPFLSETAAATGSVPLVYEGEMDSFIASKRRVLHGLPP